MPHKEHFTNNDQEDTLQTPNIYNFLDFRDYLTEFKKSASQQNDFSHRQFAKQLGMSQGFFQNLLSERRGLSENGLLAILAIGKYKNFRH